ncbi:MAG: ParM/StbA family protein [Cyanobacteria bacterium P01_H01_bin.105]
MTKTQTKIDASKAKTSFNLAVIDAGNSEIKALINGELLCLPTKYTFQVGTDRRAMMQHRAPFEGFSVTIEQEYASRCSQAGQYQFSPHKPSGDMPAETDKVLFYLPIVLGCCSAGNQDKPWYVVISHWDQYRDNEICNRLKGTFDTRVNGRELNIEIRHVEFVPEGEGADWFARLDGGIKGTIATIDIGFNTVGFNLYSGGGNIVQRKYLENTGVRKVVQNIMDDPALQATLGRRPTPKAVIDAIKNGGQIANNGVMGGNTDISEFINAYASAWLKQTLGGISRRYGEDLLEVRNYLLVGGGAHLLKAAVEGTNIIVPDNPELSNVQGMALRAAQLFAVN